MALLAIDQGNTRTKFGVFAEGTLQDTWHLPTVKSARRYAAAELFADRALPDALAIGLCTVAPETIPYWRQMAEAHGYPLTVISGRTPTPLRHAYDTPDTLGPDRLMAAVAAASRVGTPVITVSLGTANVVDAVSQDGAYLGGMIAPGIAAMSQALASAASALWAVDWREPRDPIGRTSQDALVSGLFHESLGGIRAMIQAVRHQLRADAPLALTGGWAPRVAPYLDGVALCDEHLILHGIAITLQALPPRQ